MDAKYKALILDYLKELLAIDSTTGDYAAIQKYLSEKTEALGLTPQYFNKGGFSVCAGGEGNPIVVSVHGDDIGLMVHRILENGTLQCAKIGGLHPYGAEQANVRIHTRRGGVYTGCMKRRYPSLHTMPTEAHFTQGVTYDDLLLWLDEDVHSRQEVEALGIRPGDIVALDPNLVITEKGYIKSRFLDDKAAVAVMLTYLAFLHDTGVTPGRKFTAHFSMYEEIGHGGACGIPSDTREFLSMDVGCVGPGQQADERKVSIIALDSRFPYHYDATTALAALAEEKGIPYALDIHLPRYGTDSDVALTSGHDVINTAFGPAVMGTHGYERTHIDGLAATFDLLRAYIGEA